MAFGALCLALETVLGIAVILGFLISRTMREPEWPAVSAMLLLALGMLQIAGPIMLLSEPRYRYRRTIVCVAQSGSALGLGIIAVDLLNSGFWVASSSFALTYITLGISVGALALAKPLFDIADRANALLTSKRLRVYQRMLAASVALLFGPACVMSVMTNVPQDATSISLPLALIGFAMFVPTVFMSLVARTHLFFVLHRPL